MILSYNELVSLVDDGVINTPIENINGSSIDVTLHNIIRHEQLGPNMDKIRLYDGDVIRTKEYNMDNGEFVMMPDCCVLGATNETLNMPLDISAEFSLKSSLARCFLGHELAGWIDPGFNGTLTLELKNNTQFHKLCLNTGMKIGQIKFFRHTHVEEKNSYIARGQYNGQLVVQESKGIK